MVASSKAMTVEEFLSWAEHQDGKWELVDGRPVSMAPAKVAHGTIQMNLGQTLNNAFARGPSRAVGEAGIKPDGSEKDFYVADVAVTCTPQRPGAVWIEQPVLVVEILSDSTRKHDIADKVPDYQNIASIQDILVISSEKRSVIHWRRHPDGWLQRNVIGTGEVALLGVDVRLTLEDIYQGSGL